MNRIERASREAHRVNRERLAQGLRHPEVHDTPEQEEYLAVLLGVGEEAEAGHQIHHVLQYAVTV